MINDIKNEILNNFSLIKDEIPSFTSYTNDDIFDEDSKVLLKNFKFFNHSLEHFTINYTNISGNTNNKSKTLFNVQKPENKKYTSTKEFIETLFDINLSSYEVNHIIKLIKSFWISGIYSLLNKKLNCLFVNHKLKIEGFAFEFLYIKTSLIETDKSEDNLRIFSILIKNILNGNLASNDNSSKTQIDHIKNNIHLISYLSNITKEQKYYNIDIIKLVEEILDILEENVSFFAEAVWKDPEIDNRLGNEFKNYCNQEILKNKFKKSKEIIRIIINILKKDFPHLELIKKMDNTKKGTIYNQNILNDLEKNNNIKYYIDGIIDKLLEISKKEKFEQYFNQKKKRTF